MKSSIFVIAIACLLVTCTKFNPGRQVVVSDQVIEYQLDNGQYAVVVAMDGISASQAKSMARQRAAEITVQQGNRFFVINAEQQTEVIKSDDIPYNDRFYGNMYQELIIEQDFGKRSLQRRSSPSTATYSAIRLVFTSYKDKPLFKAIDACKLTNCGP